MVRYGFLYDESRCISCLSCVIACSSNNYGEFMEDQNPNPFWRTLATNIRVVIKEVGRAEINLLSCQHCERPPCVEVCPTGASHIDRSNGLVEIDYEKCIGCKACVTACPYNARWLDKVKMLPMKCMGEACKARVSRGELPFCVAVCPANARAFGDLDNPNSDISKRIA
ncbi:MAG: 4Fe-4S dicluster domain-containing protein, partial [Fervidicoccaceae archaeon]